MCNSSAMQEPWMTCLVLGLSRLHEDHIGRRHLPELGQASYARSKWEGEAGALKGRVSPDIGLYFIFLEIKSVLSAVPLIVFTVFYFVVLEIFKNNLYTISMKTLTNYAELTKTCSRIYVPAYWYCCKNTGGFQEAACGSVNRVSKSRFVSALAGFS